MSNIKNEASIKNPLIVAIREQLEHRALWMYLLCDEAKKKGLNPEEYQFYLDLRKYGSTRHAGFGLGFERCVMYLTGMSNIRDVLPFPRTVNNCEL